MCNIFGNKKFVAVIVMTVMWETARYMTLGFMGTFKTNDLMLSMGTVQIINMAANLFRMIFSKPFGRYSDTKSYAAGYKLALIIAAVGFAINIFATPKTWWCVILFTVFYFVSLAGTNQNSFNITYSYVKNDYIVQAMAVKSCIGGIFGFAASLVGGRILTWVQNNGNMFLGIKVYGQQMLSVISLILITAAVMFTHFVVEKQEIIKQ